MTVLHLCVVLIDSCVFVVN